MLKSPRKILVDQLCTVITRKIDCQTYDTSVFRASDHDRHVLSIALENGWLSEARLRQAVHEGICREGRKSYLQHIKNDTPPYFVYSPSALGYAITQGGLTRSEIAQINFDGPKSLNNISLWAGALFENTLETVREWRKDEQYLSTFRWVLEIDLKGNMIEKPYLKYVPRLEREGWVSH